MSVSGESDKRIYRLVVTSDNFQTVEFNTEENRKFSTLRVSGAPKGVYYIYAEVSPFDN